MELLPTDVILKVAALSEDTRAVARLCASCHPIYDTLQPLLLSMQPQPHRRQSLANFSDLVEALSSRIYRWAGLDSTMLEGVEFGYNPEFDDSRR